MDAAVLAAARLIAEADSLIITAALGTALTGENGSTSTAFDTAVESACAHSRTPALMAVPCSCDDTPTSGRSTFLIVGHSCRSI